MAQIFTFVQDVMSIVKFMPLGGRNLPMKWSNEMKWSLHVECFLTSDALRQIARHLTQSLQNSNTKTSILNTPTMDLPSLLWQIDYPLIVLLSQSVYQLDKTLSVLLPHICLKIDIIGFFLMILSHPAVKEFSTLKNVNLIAFHQKSTNYNPVNF